MQFDYQVYFRQNCVVPTILLVFSLFIMVGVIYTLMSKCNHENFKSLLLKSLYLLLIGFFLISINVFRLARGGVYLFVEKENDAVELEGVIDDTFELSWFGYKYGVEQNNGKGEGIIINETKYYLVTYGNIKKGDNVLIRVLPKSKIILEIVPISNKNQSEVHRQFRLKQYEKNEIRINPKIVAGVFFVLLIMAPTFIILKRDNCLWLILILFVIIVSLMFLEHDISTIKTELSNICYWENFGLFHRVYIGQNRNNAKLQNGFLTNVFKIEYIEPNKNYTISRQTIVIPCNKVVGVDEFLNFYYDIVKRKEQNNNVIS